MAAPVCLAEGKEELMFRRSIRCAVLGALLVASLTVAPPPAQASAWSGQSGTSNVFVLAWEWVQSLWSTPTTLSCEGDCDRGHGIDPDG